MPVSISREAQQLDAIVEALKDLEHKAILNLQRAIRKHPLGGWVKDTCGVGEKQGGRLLAVLQDPFWNDLYDRPRTVRELYKYCGMDVSGGVAPRRHKGERITWNPEARKRL